MTLEVLLSKPWTERFIHTQHFLLSTLKQAHSRHVSISSDDIKINTFTKALSQNVNQTLIKSSLWSVTVI